MSTVNYAIVAERLTSERLGSYLAGSGGALEPAIALYDWNVEVGGPQISSASADLSSPLGRPDRSSTHTHGPARSRSAAATRVL